jgi:hypothetical protein
MGRTETKVNKKKGVEDEMREKGYLFHKPFDEFTISNSFTSLCQWYLDYSTSGFHIRHLYLAGAVSVLHLHSDVNNIIMLLFTLAPK